MNYHKQSMKETLSTFAFNGRRFTFCIERECDAIQKCLLNGNFFEHEELLQQARHIPEKPVILYIGANVGNHTIFYAKCIPHSHVIPFECHPEALRLLRRNISLNECLNVDTNFLGLACSDQVGTAKMVRGGPNNLGHSRLVEGRTETTVPTKKPLTPISVETLKCDDCLAAIKTIPTFIKIDVEGHEMKVLAGLERTITEHRPILFVEVSLDREVDFAEWVRRTRYAVCYRDKRYAKASNYLVKAL